MSAIKSLAAAVVLAVTPTALAQEAAEGGSPNEEVEIVESAPPAEGTPQGMDGNTESEGAGAEDEAAGVDTDADGTMEDEYAGGDEVGVVKYEDEVLSQFDCESVADVSVASRHDGYGNYKTSVGKDCRVATADGRHEVRFMASGGVWGTLEDGKPRARSLFITDFLAGVRRNLQTPNWLRQVLGKPGFVGLSTGWIGGFGGRPEVLEPLISQGSDWRNSVGVVLDVKADTFSSSSEIGECHEARNDTYRIAAGFVDDNRGMMTVGVRALYSRDTRGMHTQGQLGFERVIVRGDDGYSRYRGNGIVLGAEGSMPMSPFNGKVAAQSVVNVGVNSAGLIVNRGDFTVGVQGEKLPGELVKVDAMMGGTYVRGAPTGSGLVVMMRISGQEPLEVGPAICNLGLDAKTLHFMIPGADGGNDRGTNFTTSLSLTCK